MRWPSTRRYPATILMIGGFLAWSLAFTVMYASLSFGCAFGWDAVPVGPVSLNRAVLIAAWVLCVLGLGVLTFVTARLFTAEGKGVSAFVRTSGTTLTALALAATVGNFFMVSTMSTCL